MGYTTLDKIIKGYLLQKGYSMHWYVDFLIYTARCFQELHYDTLRNVRTVKLPVNDYNAVILPSDFLDYARIGIPDGQYVRPLVNRPGLNSVPNTDSDGTRSVYEDPEYGFAFSWADTIYYNDKGEHTGRHYGLRDYGVETFKIVKERGEIVLDKNVDANNIILEYITDGTEVDNATKIDPYAIATIEAFINWKLKENSRAYNEGERIRAQREFDHQHEILRARKNPLTLADIKSAINRNTHGSIK
jgi:hypothetical protein